MRTEGTAACVKTLTISGLYIDLAPLLPLILFPMTISVRFAPSPTGLLHVGNARTAVVTWLFARANSGKFLLRIDDTDLERSKAEYIDGIQRDLTWLGLDWDSMEHQSARMDKYDAAIEKLKADGRLYPCYETADELALKRKTLLGRGLPPIYDRGALDLDDAQIAAFEAEGRKPHWRFKLNHTPIEWDDLVRGSVSFQGKDMSDPVLIREDGSPLYHICSVVDDMEFGMTHVVRGEDHVANTAAHIQMIEALGGTAPEFAHLSMIADAEGGKLSKRLGSLTLEALREEEGVMPMAILSLLARTGTSDPIEAFADMQPLLDTFDFGKFSRATQKFDPDDLYRLSASITRELPFEDVEASLKDLGIEADETFWMTVRPNIEKLSDVKEWWHVTKGVVTPTAAAADADYLSDAASVLPEGPWTSATWKAWIGEIKGKTGRKGKGLFMPLRQALTGMDHGPELADLLPLIGEDKARARLSGKAA